MRRFAVVGLLVMSQTACGDPVPEPEPPISTSAGDFSSTPTMSPASTRPGASTSTRPATTAPAPAIAVLVFHKTEGFRHESISAGIAAITTLGTQEGFHVTATDDASVFVEAGLADYDVVVFLSTTGDVLDRAQEEAMQDFVEAGNGFVGIHSASDTEYEWTWYESLVGAYFDGHPAPQTATVEVLDGEHPAMTGLPPRIERFDEWYNFRTSPGPEITILAALDEETYEGGTMGASHPIMWAHENLGGRSFYTAFGHTIESYEEPLILRLLASAIRWAGSGN